MGNIKNLVFLTRGEIHIHTDRLLSIHIKSDDTRENGIVSLMNGEKIGILTTDPKIVGDSVSRYENDSRLPIFAKGKWYIIQTLDFISGYDDGIFVHFNFRYTLDTNYIWCKSGIRQVSDTEVLKFRKKSSLKITQ